MIHAVTVTNYRGEKIKIDLREPTITGFLIKSITGLGPVKATVNTTEIVTNDGSIFNSARLEQRNIVLELLFMNTVKGESIEDVRQKSYKYFPVKKSLTLVIETDNRCVETVGYVESNEPDIFSSQEGAQISIICPDPYFYSSGAQGTNTTVLSGTEATFEFPFSNEAVSEPALIMGRTVINTAGVVIYTGDSEVGLTIRIHAVGSVENVTIYNLETRENMKIDTTKLAKFTGNGIIAGDDIVITTTRGEKRITLTREGTVYNILNCLSKDTDWFTLVKGDNQFAYTADDGPTNLQFRIENKVVYEGV